MTARGAIILLAIGALGLAGCGGAAHRRAPAREAQAGAGAAPVGSTQQSTYSRPDPPPPRHAASRHGSHTDSGARSKTRRAAHRRDHRHGYNPSAIALATAKLRAAMKHEPKPVLIFPPASPLPAWKAGSAAVACMHAGGLYDIARRPSGAWAGTDPSNVQVLYVTGPYPAAVGAAALARSLSQRELARSGGRYVGFATFRSALSGELGTVTTCLARGGPKHALGF